MGDQIYRGLKGDLQKQIDKKPDISDLKTVAFTGSYNDLNNKPTLNTVTQTATTTDANYEVLFSGTADNTTRTEGAGKAATLRFNPNKRALMEGGSTTASGDCSHAEGYYTTADGSQSHAEGYYTSAKGTNAHAEGDSTTASGNYSHAEGGYTKASGVRAHAEGYFSTASGDGSHAEGGYTTSYASKFPGGFAYGYSSHAEGVKTSALGVCSHAEGYISCAASNYTHAEGSNTKAGSNNSHAEGDSTVAYGVNSHAEGYYTTAYGANSHAEGYYTSAKGSRAHAEGGSTIASGNYSHAEGSNTCASAYGAHAEGYSGTSTRYIVASGQGSHAEGYTDKSNNNIVAKGKGSHAEGYGTTANGDYSHAEGSNTYAEPYGHAEGYFTTAWDYYCHSEGYATSAAAGSSHAEGFRTTTTNMASHATGHFNAAMTTGGGSGNTTGTAFVIGNGTSINACKNAFSVQFNGVVKAASTITASTTADYAEYFEWSDGNPNTEDRVGYFVTFDDKKKIKIANSNDNYILGIVSGEPFVLGNGDCDVWNGMVLRDEFNRVRYEPAQKYEIDPETGEEIPVYDDKGNPVYEGTKPVYNPNYDPSIPYISRADRPEWAAIGMLGVLAVRDDGTCEVNDYCTVNEDGIATKANKSDINKYRVIQRNTENVVEIVFR